MSLLRRKMVGTGVSRLRTVPLPVGVFGVPPVSGYVGWFDALDTANITKTAGAVSQWTDKSGNGNNLTQATAANQPIYGLGQLNGLPCMNFDGSNDVFAATGISGSDRTSSYFMVASIPSLIALNSYFGSNGGTGGFELRNEVTSGLVTVLRSGVSNIFQTTSLAVPTVTPFVLGCVLTATDATIYVNLSSENGANSDTFTAGRTTVVGQNRSGGTSFARINVGEVIVYDSSLSSGNTSLVIAYLMSKWGIV